MEKEVKKTAVDEIRFDGNGLVPAIVQDIETGRVLTLAYMNRESLELTLKTGETVFWSRSRGELWHKGETSGNFQHVKAVIADCDRDALTVLVEKDGPACHLGTDSCFEYPLYGEAVSSWSGTRGEKQPEEPSRTENGTQASSEAGSADIKIERKALYEEDPADLKQERTPFGFTLSKLYELLQERKRELPEGSYTSYLFGKGTDKILKKVGEESTEVIIAAKADDKPETVYEIADLVYHVLVLMVEMGISVEDIRAELESRSIIDHKVKQEHMTGDSAVK